MKKPTTERLAEALEEKYRELPCFPALIEMASRAREGYYDDYKSPLVNPIGRLVEDLQALGLGEMAGRAINGEWDATKEESDAWAKSPDGQRTMTEVFKNHIPPKGRRIHDAP